MRPKGLPLNGNLDRVPEVIAYRERMNNSCTDPDCGLSAGSAHAGWCEECDCGLFHAAAECKVAHDAGWA